jgi:hypothetical protein
MKAVRQVIASNGVPYLQTRSVISHITSGREKEGNVGNQILKLPSWLNHRRLTYENKVKNTQHQHRILFIFYVSKISYKSLNHNFSEYSGMQNSFL